MGTFKAIRIDKAEKGTTVALTQFDEAELMDGDVTVARRMVDAELQGRSRRHRQGAGGAALPDDRRHRLRRHRRAISHPQWKAGDKVVCNGWGMGETHLGAYAEKARVKGDWLVRLPEGMSTRDAMAIGTAGYTAMLSVLALEKHGLTPASGPVVVTGAAGGVGSVAIAVLSKLGYHVIASTGRMSEADYLKGLGAAEVIDRARTVGAGQAAGEGALGGRHRQRRLDHARQSAVDDEIWRRHRRLRACRRHGPAVLGRAVYFARGVPSRHRFRDVPAATAQGSPGAASPAIWTRQNLLKLLMKLASIRSSAAGAKILAGQVRGRIVVKIL